VEKTISNKFSSNLNLKVGKCPKIYNKATFRL
jgi:hypothetical protein